MMKDIACASIVVATLIVAVMFAAAFTVPGGNNVSVERKVPSPCKVKGSPIYVALSNIGEHNDSKGGEALLSLLFSCISSFLFPFAPSSEVIRLPLNPVLANARVRGQGHITLLLALHERTSERRDVSLFLSTTFFLLVSSPAVLTERPFSCCSHRAPQAQDSSIIHRWRRRNPIPHTAAATGGTVPPKRPHNVPTGDNGHRTSSSHPLLL
ncbi:hypothetical protein HHK36_030517 [Tetracentron sinense]|uniref:PGG domain-containing protein n=1 Tax=Tetracentron sinense TaxID=13715 RepID=A0A834Y9Z9_TETSI|nr:hypothetical protein HHK36_030517 [Tetracentron sinense]